MIRIRRNVVRFYGVIALAMLPVVTYAWLRELFRGELPPMSGNELAAFEAEWRAEPAVNFARFATTQPTTQPAVDAAPTHSPPHQHKH